MKRERILVIDDEASMRRFLTMLLEAEGYEVSSAENGADGVSRLDRETFDVVIADLKMPGVDGLSVLDSVHGKYPELPVVILTAYGSERVAAEAARRGAFQLVEKSSRNEEIVLVINNAVEMSRVRHQNKTLKWQLRKGHQQRRMIGRAEEMQKVFTMIEKVATSEATILIFGESGTGKELIAREIHYQSRRSKGPFISINCGALHRDLLESTLFGHKRGSFTGAVKDQAGHFVASEGGTFFLDEVGEMAPATQVKLLRALQEREIIPIGSSEPVQIDVRLVAATNADLEAAVAEGRFRHDLFYRLNVIPICLPPLRRRADDIPLLVDHFISRHASEGISKKVGREVMDALVRYDWPGNVRELENVIERAVILSDGDVLTLEDIPEKVLQGPGHRGSFTIEAPTVTLADLEREYILKVLHHTRWQKKRAAEILGINASTLYRKLLSYGITERPGEAGQEEAGEEEAA
ncbi:MAG: sigma-54-dependent Fis family transcriptional regulator [Candidatus Eisenbacteria sp.]|nr:sigma-54-dependent Fis family transcriptional regulator [Candidatus Eisenbacteria bacterium]